MTIINPNSISGISSITALNSTAAINLFKADGTAANIIAGVTTGAVTFPLVLAMGLGLGNAVSATEGFGILSMASICPILAVLLMGLYIQFKQKHNKKEI